MATRSYGHMRDPKTGKIVVVETQGMNGLLDAPKGSVTRAQRKSAQTPIKKTPAPKSRWQQFKRDAWG